MLILYTNDNICFELMYKFCMLLLNVIINKVKRLLVVSNSGLKAVSKFDYYNNITEKKLNMFFFKRINDIIVILIIIFISNFGNVHNNLSCKSIIINYYIVTINIVY